MQSAVFGLMMFVFSAIMFASSFSLPPGLAYTSPATFPRICIAGLAFFSLAFAVSSWRDKTTSVSLMPSKRQLTFLGTFLAYILSLYWIGFKIASVLCFMAVVWFWVPREQRKKSMLPAFLLGVATTAFIYFVFDYCLNIYLP